MAGIAIILDFLRKNPSFSGQQFHSRGLFSNAIAASFAVSTPFAYRALFGSSATNIAYCDAGTALGEDYISNTWTPSGSIFQNDALKYSTKQYFIELKPLHSAFHWKTLALTSLRSFLLFYLPLLEPHSPMEEEEDDFLQENPEVNRLDLIVPFKKSVKQICRETTVVTTRRILERLAVHYISQRMAWKLLKDVPKSATRKYGRGMPTLTYIFCVSRTTFRGHWINFSMPISLSWIHLVDTECLLTCLFHIQAGHFLGVLASWFVQVGIDIYRFVTSISTNSEESDTIDRGEQLQVLGKKVRNTTFKCCAALVFASIGAGIGAIVIRPSTGQWIGCAIGDLAGPTVLSFCLGNRLIDL